MIRAALPRTRARKIGAPGVAGDGRTEPQKGEWGRRGGLEFNFLHYLLVLYFF
jgi:hypothetical protein